MMAERISRKKADFISEVFMQYFTKV